MVVHVLDVADLVHLVVLVDVLEMDVLHVEQDAAPIAVAHLHVETVILDVDLINIGGR